MKIIKVCLVLLSFIVFFRPQTAFSQASSKSNFTDVSFDEALIPCTNEILSGKVTLRYFTVLSKDGKITKALVQPQGGKLIGSPTGTVYNVVGVDESKETTIWDEQTVRFSGIDNYHLVGTGKNGVKYRIHVNLHYSCDFSGDFTFSFDKKSVSCE